MNLIAICIVLLFGLQTEDALSTLRPTHGALVIVGGGGTPDIVKSTALALTGKPSPQVLIFAQASRRKDAASGNVKMWRAAGARRVEIAVLSDPKALARAIAKADLLWMGGGSQNRLMKALGEAGAIELIQDRHRKGAVVGGTSAGAAVMTPLMLTGDADLERINQDTTSLAAGLGLFPNAIIDQHFQARRRFHRLASAVLSHPSCLGLGIDEKTAIVVNKGQVKVIGESGVLVLDARSAKISTVPRGQPRPFEGLKVHHLVAGQTYSLKVNKEK